MSRSTQSHEVMDAWHMASKIWKLFNQSDSRFSISYLFFILRLRSSESTGETPFTFYLPTLDLAYGEFNNFFKLFCCHPSP